MNLSHGGVAALLTHTVAQDEINTAPLQSVITVLTVLLFAAAAAGVVFGLAAIADAARARKTGRKPRISPNVNGPRLIVLSIVAVALVVPLRLMS